MLLHQDVAPPVDFVVEPHVVDHDRVETAHVEGALTSRGHRKEIRLLLTTLEKGPDYPNRLSAMVIRGIDAWRVRLHVLGRGFHTATRRNEHRNPASLPNGLLQEFL